MPTGYTADVADGKVTDLKPFVLQLARGMGALIMMRDDPWDAPIPERFEPSDYHAKKLVELTAERERLYALTGEEADDEADREYIEDCASRDQYTADQAARRGRYTAMLEKVKSWEGAPEGIKEFGIEQLERGMEFDCPLPFKYYREVKQKTGAEWRAKALEEVARQIEYHAAEDAKDRARTESRNAWIVQLRKSLPNEPATPTL
jgi:hypothetical protein